ncbi:phage tail terminator protein [Kluyvera cryocrescens]|uniref:phage tail terminator protein n=1 Tax=Kluyvera cryocrescens TaxID=580 RepID=UPI0039F60889
MKNSDIRIAVLTALQRNISDSVTWFDGRPGFLDEQDLPAVAVYLSDARASDESVDEDMWTAVLHVEVFLKATATDSVLDSWMEDRIYPAMADVPELADLLELIVAQGYDYQRDEEAMTWGSADLSYSISYIM